MKSITHILAISLITTTLAHAIITDMRSTEGVTVTWGQDSCDGFNLLLSGTGIPFDRTGENISGIANTSYYEWYPFGDPFQSPSGQWIIQAGLSVQVYRNAAIQFIGLDYQMIGNIWNPRLTDGFLLLDSADPGFVRSHYSELMTEKYQSGETFASWAATMATNLYGEQLDNPATWAWTMNIISHAPNAHGVPDAGSSAALLGIAVFALGFVRRTR